MRKVIVLGLDGGVPYQFHKRALRGELPNIKRLIDDGFFAPALPLPSGVTPVNWLSVVTGAYSGTHGVSEFCVHLPGTPLTEWREAFHSDVCQAEFIRDALARAGLKTAAISFPGSYPRTCGELIAIGDVGRPGDGSSPYETTRLTPQQELVTVVSDYYKGDHGSSRPSKRFGLGAETALFGIYGAGIRKVGYRHKPIKLTDVTPTICALLGVNPPAQCEGTVVRDCINPRPRFLSPALHSRLPSLVFGPPSSLFVPVDVVAVQV